MEQRFENFADVALFLLECFRHSVDQRGRRIVRHEALSQFQRDEMRGLRARREQVEHFLAFVLAFRLDAMSENELRTGLVHAWLIAESEAFERLLDRPSGKYFGDLGDIALRVSALHA